jgi:hypothetical protein
MVRAIGKKALYLPLFQIFLLKSIPKESFGIDKSKIKNLKSEIRMILCPPAGG